MKIGTTFQLKTLREWLMLLCFFPLMVFAESEHVEITLSAPDAAVKNRFLCDSDLDQTLKVFFPYLHPNASKVVPLKTPKKLDLDDVFQRKNFDLFQVKKDPEPDLMGPTLEAYFNFILNRQVSYQPVDVQRLLERGNDTLLSLTPLLDDKKLRFVPEGTLPGQPARVLDRKSFLPQFTVEDESGHLFLRNKQSLGDDLEVVLDRGRLTLVPRPKHPEPERELEWDVLPNGAIQLTPKLSGMLRGTALGTDPQEPTDSPEAPFPFNDIARNPVFYENIDDVSHHRQILLATTAALKCGANSQLSYYLQKLLNQGTLSELPKGVHFSALVDKPPVETLVQLLRNENPRERDLWAEQLAKSVLQLIHPDISIGGGIHTPFAQWLSQTPKPDQKTQELINSKGMEYLVGALNSDYLRLKLKGENLPTVKSSPHFHWNETLKDKRLGPWHVLSDVPFSEHYPPSGQYFGKDIQRVLSNLIRDPSNPWHLNDMHYVAGRLKDIPFHSEIERDLMHEWVKERLGEINKGDFDDRIRTQREEGHSTGPRDWRRTLSLRHALGEFDKALRQSTVQAPAQELSEEEIEEQFGESWVKKPGKKVHAITAEHYRYRDPGLARREFRQTYEKVSPEIRAEMESIEKNLKEKADFALSNGAMTGILKLPAFHRNLLLKMLQHITPDDKKFLQKAFTDFEPLSLVRFLQYHATTGRLAGPLKSLFEEFSPHFDPRRQRQLTRLMEPSSKYFTQGGDPLAYTDRLSLRDHIEEQLDTEFLKGRAPAEREKVQALTLLDAFINHGGEPDTEKLRAIHDGRDPADPHEMASEWKEYRETKKRYGGKPSEGLVTRLESDLVTPVSRATKTKLMQLPESSRDRLTRLWDVFKATEDGRNTYKSVLVNANPLTVLAVAENTDRKFHDYMASYPIPPKDNEVLIQDLLRIARQVQAGKPADESAFKTHFQEATKAASMGEASAAELNERVREVAGERLVREMLKKPGHSAEATRNDPGLYHILSAPLRERLSAANQDMPDEIEPATREQITAETHAEGKGTIQAIIDKVSVQDLIFGCVRAIEDPIAADKGEQEALTLEKEAEQALDRKNSTLARELRESSYARWNALYQGQEGVRLPPPLPILRSEAQFDRKQKEKEILETYRTKTASLSTKASAAQRSVTIADTQIRQTHFHIKKLKDALAKQELRGSTEALVVRQMELLRTQVANLEAVLVKLETEKTAQNKVFADALVEAIDHSQGLGKEVLDQNLDELNSEYQTELNARSISNDDQFLLWADRCLEAVRKKGKSLPPEVTRELTVDGLKDLSLFRERAKDLFRSAYVIEGGASVFENPTFKKQLLELERDLTSGDRAVRLTEAQAKELISETREKILAEFERKDREFRAISQKLKAQGLVWNGTEVDWPKSNLVGKNLDEVKQALKGLSDYGHYASRGIDPWMELKDMLLNKRSQSGNVSKFEFAGVYAIEVKPEFEEHLFKSDDTKYMKFLDLKSERAAAKKLSDEIDHGEDSVIAKIRKAQEAGVKDISRFWGDDFQRYYGLIDSPSLQGQLDSARNSGLGTISAKAQRLMNDYGGISVGDSENGEPNFPGLIRGAQVETMLKLELMPDEENFRQLLLDLQWDKVSHLGWSIATEAVGAGLLARTGKVIKAGAEGGLWASRIEKLNGIRRLVEAGKLSSVSQIDKAIRGYRMGYRISNFQKGAWEEFTGDVAQMDTFSDRSGHLAMMFAMQSPLNSMSETALEHVGMAWWLREGLAGVGSMAATNYAIERARGVPESEARWNSLKMAPLAIPFDRYLGSFLIRRNLMPTNPLAAESTAMGSAYLPNVLMSGAFGYIEYETLDAATKENLKAQGIHSARDMARKNIKDSVVLDMVASVNARQRAKMDTVKYRMVADPNFTYADAIKSKELFQRAVQDMRMEQIADLQARTQRAEVTAKTPEEIANYQRLREFNEAVAAQSGFGDAASFGRAVGDYLGSGSGFNLGQRQLENAGRVLRSKARGELVEKVRRGEVAPEVAAKSALLSSDDTTFSYLPADSLRSEIPAQAELVTRAAKHYAPEAKAEGSQLLAEKPPKPGESIAEYIFRVLKV